MFTATVAGLEVQNYARLLIEQLMLAFTSASHGAQQTGRCTCRFSGSSCSALSVSLVDACLQLIFR